MSHSPKIPNYWIVAALAQKERGQAVGSPSNGSAATTKTHWACACVKRDRDGKLSAIKLHSQRHVWCPTCGAKRPKR